MPLFRRLTAASLVALAGAACKPSPPPKPADKPVEKPLAAKPAKARTVKRMWMVPHPSEIMAVMRTMGLADKTAALVPFAPVDFKPMDGQRVAFTTGALVADLVLSLEGSKGADVSRRLDVIGKGLAELGMQDTQLVDLDKLSKRLASGKMTPEELGGELDVLQGRLMDDVSQYSSQDALVGLQAGAWVRAVNVVATLLVDTQKAGEGAHLFAQPALVEYFSDHLKKNTDKAVENPALEASLPHLAELRRIALKEAPSADDVPVVQKNTAAILAQFRNAGGTR